MSNTITVNLFDLLENELGRHSDVEIDLDDYDYEMDESQIKEKALELNWEVDEIAEAVISGCASAPDLIGQLAKHYEAHMVQREEQLERRLTEMRNKLKKTTAILNAVAKLWPGNPQDIRLIRGKVEEVAPDDVDVEAAIMNLIGMAENAQTAADSGDMVKPEEEV